MGLSADLENAGASKPRCTTCAALKTLPPKESEALRVAISDGALSIRSIVDVCRKNEVNVSRGSVSEHRSGRCPKP